MFPQKREKDVFTVLDRMGKGENLFSHFLDDLCHFHGVSPLKGINNPDFSPSLDLIEKENEFILNLEVPGIEKNGIEIEIDDNILVIKGEKKQKVEEKDEDFYICERSYGAFRRELRIFDNCEKNKIEADYKDGILSIKLPKKEIKEKEKRKVCIKEP
jgi:HSP20 family protein